MCIHPTAIYNGDLGCLLFSIFHFHIFLALSTFPYSYSVALSLSRFPTSRKGKVNGEWRQVPVAVWRCK
jgi:hypothetical protein